ncbi:MAG: GNAT family N-acetyltransferase, partial [Firmicutes bacterium]|nr:GNAT family N-acetyltransferase [Bacillota bacterium]
MSIAYHIRKAEPRDVKPLAQLDARCFASPWSEQSFEEDVVNNPLAFYLVAESEQGEIIGYAGVWMIVGEGHITNVAASPDHRRCGVARAVLTQIHGKEKNHNAQPLKQCHRFLEKINGNDTYKNDSAAHGTYIA